MRRVSRTKAKALGFALAVRRALSAPLNRGRPLYALGRVLSWQIGSRLSGRDLVVPFVGETRLIGRTGMTGMTQNVYNGLAEPGPMGFLLHLLRPGDLFVDAGANVGVYTVLASGVCGARSIACEPIEAGAAVIRRNVGLNGIGERVDIFQCALGAYDGTICMTRDFDAENRVVEAAAATPEHLAEVPVTTLDALLEGRVPKLIKIDVEGYEEQVVSGARTTLAAHGLAAVIMEIWSRTSSDRRRHRRLTDEMKRFGFAPFVYNPLVRKLSPFEAAETASDEVIFCRDGEALSPFLRDAPRHRVHGTSI